MNDRAEADGPSENVFMIDGVDLLSSVLDGDGERPVVTLADATAAARHFFLLGNATLARARFGGSQRAADVACFETFRLAGIAARVDDSFGEGAVAVLGQIAGWHRRSEHAASEETRELWSQLWNGVKYVDDNVGSLSSHSLLLKIASSNRSVTELIEEQAVKLIDSVVRLDRDPADASAHESFDAAAIDDEFAEQIELIRNSLFILPRGRASLRMDPEFDRLRQIFEAAVPWSHRPLRRPDR